MTATPFFGPASPDAVRCKDCQHCPAQPNKFCAITHRQLLGYGYWRKCSSHSPAPRQAPALQLAQARQSDHRERWRYLDARDGDLWLGCEPLWSYAWDEASEAEVMDDIRAWLRHRRHEAIRHAEAWRRRASIRSV